MAGREDEPVIPLWADDAPVVALHDPVVLHPVPEHPVRRLEADRVAVPERVDVPEPRAERRAVPGDRDGAAEPRHGCLRVVARALAEVVQPVGALHHDHAQAEARDAEPAEGVAAFEPGPEPARIGPDVGDAGRRIRRAGCRRPCVHLAFERLRELVLLVLGVEGRDRIAPEPDDCCVRDEQDTQPDQDRAGAAGPVSSARALGPRRGFGLRLSSRRDRRAHEPSYTGGCGGLYLPRTSAPIWAAAAAARHRHVETTGER